MANQDGHTSPGSSGITTPYFGMAADTDTTSKSYTEVNKLSEIARVNGSQLRFKRFVNPISDGAYLGELMNVIRSAEINYGNILTLPHYGEPFIWTSTKYYLSSENPSGYDLARRAKFFIGAYQNVKPSYNIALNPTMYGTGTALDAYQPPYFIGPYYANPDDLLISVDSHPYSANVGVIKSKITSIGSGLTLSSDGVLSATGSSSGSSGITFTPAGQEAIQLLGVKPETRNTESKLTTAYGSTELWYSPAPVQFDTTKFKALVINGDAIVPSLQTSRNTIAVAHQLLGTSGIILQSDLTTQVNDYTLTTIANPQTTNYWPVVWNENDATSKLAVRVQVGRIYTVSPIKSMKVSNTTTDGDTTFNIDLATCDVVIPSSVVLSQYTRSNNSILPSTFLRQIPNNYTSYFIINIDETVTDANGRTLYLQMPVSQKVATDDVTDAVAKREAYFLIINQSGDDINVIVNNGSTAYNIFSDNRGVVTIPTGSAKEISAIITGTRTDGYTIWTSSSTMDISSLSNASTQSEDE